MSEKLILCADEEWKDKRIDVFVSQNTDYSRNSVQLLLEEDKIFVNDKKVTKSYKMKTGDVLTIIVEEAKDKMVHCAGFYGHSNCSMVQKWAKHQQRPPNNIVCRNRN